MNEKTKPRPPHLDEEEDALDPSAPDAPAVDVKSGSPVRCPYCHDTCTASDERAVVCRDCLSRHHDACWREGEARCSSCGSKRVLRGRDPEVKVAPAELQLVKRGLSREAVDRLRRRYPELDEAASLRALLEAASRALNETDKTEVLGLSQGSVVAIVAIGGVLLIPILAILFG